jgi:hypothetical protein
MQHMYTCIVKSEGIIRRRREDNKEKWQKEERDGSTEGETEFGKFLFQVGDIDD